MLLKIFLVYCLTFSVSFPYKGTHNKSVFTGGKIYNSLQVYRGCILNVFIFFYFSYATLFMQHVVEEITDSPTFSGNNPWTSHHSYLPFLLYVYSQYVSISDEECITVLIFVIDGVPKEGLRIQDVLVRISVMSMINQKVSLYLHLIHRFIVMCAILSLDFQHFNILLTKWRFIYVPTFIYVWCVSTNLSSHLIFPAFVLWYR